MDDEALRAKYKKQKKNRELLLKQLYFKQINSGSVAEWFDIIIIAKELLPEVEIGEIELRQHYNYFVEEGLFADEAPQPPYPFNKMRKVFFPDTWLIHKGIKDIGKVVHPKICTYFSGFSVVLKDSSYNNCSFSTLFNQRFSHLLGG